MMDNARIVMLKTVFYVIVKIFVQNAILITI